MKNFISKLTILFFVTLALVVLLWVLITNPVYEDFSSPLPESLASNTRLLADVKHLSQLRPTRNYKDIDVLNYTAKYVFDRLKALGYEPWYQEFDVEGVKYKNVVTRTGSGLGDIVVVGAHYDVAGQNNPGADDNASGVASLLELARLMKLTPYIKNRIEIVFWTLEEPPFFRTDKMGSFKHAAFLKENNENIKLMLSLETMGYFDSTEGSQKYPIDALEFFYPTKGDFIALVGGLQFWSQMRSLKENFFKGTHLDKYSINAPGFVRGVDFSDHLNYAAHRWPSFMVTDTAFYRNFEYHKANDTFKRLNYTKLALVTDGVLSVLLNY